MRQSTNNKKSAKSEAEIKPAGKTTPDKKASVTDTTEKSANELAIVRKALAEVEELRFSQGLNVAESMKLESVSVALREKERGLIENIGTEISEKINASSMSLVELTKAMKLKNKGFSKIPKTLDKLSDLLTLVIDIAGKIRK